MALNKWDKQHLINLGLTQRQIDMIFTAAAKEAAAIGVSLDSFNPDKPFSFADYPETKARIEKIVQSLHNNIEIATVNGVRSEWTLANNKNNALCDRVFGANKYNLTKAQERKYYSNNDKALEAFINRKTAGLNLSDRVWNYTDQFKTEIEIGLDLGIRNGLSAPEMARDLKKYLKEPDRLFRRVRDEHGQLQLSRNAKAYNPGAGRYRSSYKNAMRLARTENNMAYRTSDHERWQQLDFVVGIEIRLSNNHTVNGVPLTDICDQLQGKYPKDFKFTGWHPQCRCHAISILKTQEEMMRDNERIMNGEEPSAESENTMKDVPDNFRKWIENNQERAKGWSNMPYFVRDNAKFVKTKFDVNTYSNEEKKFTQASKTKDAMQRVIDKLAKTYPNIPNTELAAIHHYTQSNGNYRQLNKQMDAGTLTEFNRAAQTLITQGLEKLPIYEGSVYRGMIIKRNEFKRIFGDKGSTVQQDRFVSSSMDSSVAARFAKHSPLKKNEISVFIEIQSKTGRDISKISEFNGNLAPENQKEILFTNNTKFRIADKRTNKDGSITLKLVEL
jgi:hypothetical protein